MPSFSSSLEHAIHAALATANERSHEFATLEHLLLALLDEPDAEKVLRACDVDIGKLRSNLSEFIDHELTVWSQISKQRGSTNSRLSTGNTACCDPCTKLSP